MQTYSTVQLDSRSSLQVQRQDGILIPILMAAMVFIVGIGLFKLGEWAATKNERELLTIRRTQENLNR